MKKGVWRSDPQKMLKFASFDAAFAYAAEKGEAVIVEIVAPAPGSGVYQVYPDGGAIRQLGEGEVQDGQL